MQLDVIENEYHFIIICPLYRQLNTFKQLMQNDKLSLLRKLSKYIYMANTKRESKTVP